MNFKNPQVRRLAYILQAIRELSAKDEKKLDLQDLVKATRIPFIQLCADINFMIDNDLLTFSQMREYNFAYTHYVKRVNKTNGKTFKPVKYFG